MRWLTKKYLDPFGRGISFHAITKGDFIQRRFSKPSRRVVDGFVLWVGRLGLGDARRPRQGRRLEADGVLGEERRGLGPDGRVKVQGVPAVVDVVAGHGPVVLNGVVLERVVQVKGGAVARGGQGDGRLHGAGERRGVNVDAVAQGLGERVGVNVETVAGEVAVVGERIEHGTWCAACKFCK